jgi:hypothetical protein
VHYFLHNPYLLDKSLARVGVIYVDDGSRIYNVHLVVHYRQADKILIMIILRRVAVLADRTTKHYVCKRIACRLDLASAIYEMMRTLCGVD